MGAVRKSGRSKGRNGRPMQSEIGPIKVDGPIKLKCTIKKSKSGRSDESKS